LVRGSDGKDSTGDDVSNVPCLDPLLLPLLLSDVRRNGGR
jgi:hypothetical protein